MTNSRGVMPLVSEYCLNSPLYNATIASMLRALVGLLFQKFCFFMDCPRTPKATKQLCFHNDLGTKGPMRNRFNFFPRTNRVFWGKIKCLHFVSSKAESVFVNRVLGRKAYGCHGNKISLNSMNYLSLFNCFFTKVLAICILRVLFIVFLNFHIRISSAINECMCMKH